MPTIDSLDKAIAAHAGWKARLRAAARTGTFEVATATVKADDRCDFGKWLYGKDLTPEERQGEHYQKVRTLHAQFHQHAAQVVELATLGQKAEAEQAIALGSPYAQVSTELTGALVKWRESLYR
jgi:hypothetical protein